MSNEKMCIVKNRSAGMVVYRIPELGIRREFAPGETKKISYDELVKLSYRSGGRPIMENFLQIDLDTAGDLGVHTEPEYSMSEQDIRNLIVNGSLDAFLDCLDFAPVGVIDILKKMAVSIPMTDYEKRQALKEKTGFDVDTALRHIEAEKAEDNAGEKVEPVGRRVKTEEKPAAPERRTNTTYKVVNKTTTEE